MSEALAPLHVFRFEVTFAEDPIGGAGSEGAVALCSGSFAECSGLEATMEPAVIREGGRNYGAAQRAGPVTFATVILKRGITRTRDLWKWFELVNGGAYAYRLAATITVFEPPATAPARTADAGARLGRPALRWKLRRCLPVKFKAPDLDAKAGEVGIEELHLAHEGLLLLPPEGSP
ncbi:phage tail protein [Sorangium sp. So ce1128]